MEGRGANDDVTFSQRKLRAGAALVVDGGLLSKLPLPEYW